jgi:hypothetical protein
MNDAFVAFAPLVALFVAVLGLTLVLGGPTIAALRRLSFRQSAYEDAPKTHAKKSGTPTMGGVLFAIGLVGAAILHPDPATLAIAALGAMCLAIGFADDYTSIRRGRNRGLRARDKFLLTIVAAVAFLALAARVDAPALRDVVFTFGSARAARDLGHDACGEPYRRTRRLGGRNGLAAARGLRVAWMASGAARRHVRRRRGRRDDRRFSRV